MNRVWAFKGVNKPHVPGESTRPVLHSNIPSSGIETRQQSPLSLSTAKTNLSLSFRGSGDKAVQNPRARFPPTEGRALTKPWSVRQSEAIVIDDPVRSERSTYNPVKAVAGSQLPRPTGKAPLAPEMETSCRSVRNTNNGDAHVILTGILSQESSKQHQPGRQKLCAPSGRILGKEEKMTAVCALYGFLLKHEDTSDWVLQRSPENVIQVFRDKYKQHRIAHLNGRSIAALRGYRLEWTFDDVSPGDLALDTSPQSAAVKKVGCDESLEGQADEVQSLKPSKGLIASSGSPHKSTVSGLTRSTPVEHSNKLMAIAESALAKLKGLLKKY